MHLKHLANFKLPIEKKKKRKENSYVTRLTRQEIRKHVPQDYMHRHHNDQTAQSPH